MTTRVCFICGDVLQHWEIASHDDCASRNGFVAEIDVLEWNDERNEREIIRDEMRRRPTMGTKQKTVHELTDTELEEWAKEE